MKTQHVFSASAAAVLAMTMAAFAQAPETSKPATADRAQAQTSRQPATKVTLVGCVMRETDYRKANDSGRGGPAATGLGLGNEFVLVNAAKVAPDATPAATAGECGATTGGQAYELSGNRERELAKYVSRRVEITGTLKEAKTGTGPTGEAKPTGGFDPLKQDLKLFEVEVASFREVPAQSSQATSPAPPAAAQAPAPAATPAQPEPQPPVSTAPRQNLPRTSSAVPLIGLIGVLSMAAGLALSRRG